MNNIEKSLRRGARANGRNRSHLLNRSWAKSESRITKKGEESSNLYTRYDIYKKFERNENGAKEERTQSGYTGIFSWQHFSLTYNFQVESQVKRVKSKPM